jgi:hypothetical protein
MLNSSNSNNGGLRRDYRHGLYNAKQNTVTTAPSVVGSWESQQSRIAPLRHQQQQQPYCNSSKAMRRTNITTVEMTVIIISSGNNMIMMRRDHDQQQHDQHYDQHRRRESTKNQMIMSLASSTIPLHHEQNHMNGKHNYTILIARFQRDIPLELDKPQY